MKNIIANLSLVFMLSMALASSYAENLSEQVADNSRSVNPYEGSFSYEASSPVDIQLPNFSLTADSGSLLHGVDIQVSMLPYKSGMMMQSNMENVCLLSDGVRLLPNGEHFSEDTPALITLAYDPARIPMGYAPTDIYTYYSDDNTNWYRLERVAVDTVAHTVLSYTTHFTDFANAVIKVPEMPESKAFVPTAMTDIPDADPMHGIPMIEVPKPNNKGTAEITYPIELPKGRHGMQPNVDLHYSSAGGNSFLGVGWNLTTPAITIDTRWGVPRYDPNYETEQYLVNGYPVLQRDSNSIAMALPYQDNSYLPRTKGRVRFYARDTKNADRIIRYGTNPNNYCWVVTDRNGITTFYGILYDPSHPNIHHIDESSVVRTQDRCIAYWAATASVDVYGNYILYNNEKSGNNIYVREILYTGNILQQIPPLYRLQLEYMNRSDTRTNGRLGVLQTEGKLLCHLLVQYLYPENPTIEYADNLAAYYFQYTEPQESTLYQSRLDEVVMLDSVHYLSLDTVCNLQTILHGEADLNRVWHMALIEAENNHDMHMYASLLEPYGGSVPASITRFQYADAPSATNLFSSPKTISNSGSSPLFGNRNSSWSIGGTVTVGTGANVALTTFSGGGNYDYSRSTGKVTTMLLDLNGDGLTDIVSESNGIVSYRRQYTDGGTYAFANPVNISGLTRLSHEVTNTHTWGLQLSLGANLSYSHPTATTYTDAYFSDINADGLPDMIDGDVIRINHLVNGVPSFSIFTGVDTETITVNNSHCDKHIIIDGEVDEHIECDLVEVLVDSYSLDDFFGVSPEFEFNVEPVIDEHKDEYPELRYYSGGIMEVDKQEAVLNEIDGLGENAPDIPISSKSAQLLPGLRSDSLVVEDSLIYRIEGGFVNVYKLEYVCTPVKRDPEIEMVRVWVASNNGNIILKDSISLIPDTSESRSHSLTADGVTYCIQHCDSVTALNDGMRLHAMNYAMLKKGLIEADDICTHALIDTLSVKKGDVLMFRLRSRENHLFDKTHWRHVIRYLNETNEYDSENDYLCTGDGYFQAHNAGSVILTFSGSNDGTEPVVLRVRKNNQSSPYLHETTLPHGNINISLPMLSVSAGDSLIISLSPQSNSNTEPRWSDVHLIPQLKYISLFQISEDSTQTVQDTVTYYPDVRITHSSFYPASSPYRKLFGPLHNGWGEFAYQDINHRDTIIIDSLVNTQLLSAQQISSFSSYSLDTTLFANSNEDALLNQVNGAFAGSGSFNPTAENNYWVPLHADCQTEQWMAYGNLGCIGKYMHSNAREVILPDTVQDIVEYDSSIPYTQGEIRPNKFVRKQSRSVQNSISWGAMIMNQSVSFGTYDVVVDYMDMNGDSYPDFVGKGGIQYSTPWGGIGQLRSVEHFSPVNSSNTAGGISFAACPAQLKKIAGNNIRDGKFCLNATFGGSGNYGSSSSKISYIDVNGDGLPDKVDVNNFSVRYNLGYSFSSPYGFYNTINEGSNTSFSSTVSFPPFSIGQVSISGGVGGSYSIDKTNRMMADINGDGLLDQIWIENSQVKVSYNKGLGSGGVLYDTAKTLHDISDINRSRTENVSTTLGATGGFTIMGAVKFDFGVQSSPYCTSFSQGEVMFADMDGDGMTDYVWQEGNQIRVRYNTAGRANLLTSITNPTGQEIRLEYNLSAPSVTHRSRQWELVRIEDRDVNHPMDDAILSQTIVAYNDAYYDNYEKTDYGYAHVRSTVNNEKVKDEYYHNRTFLQNGELYEDCLADISNHKYIRHTHGSRYLDITINDTTNNGLNICDDANARVEQDGYRTEYYEGESLPQIVTKYDIDYDQHHNIVRYIDFGDISIPDDDWRQEITYLNTQANNLVSLPKTEKVFSSSGRLMRSSYVNYDSHGNPAHIHFEDTVLHADATTHVAYDNLGNISDITMPEDANSEYSWMSFSYDSAVHSYVVMTDNTYAVKTQTDYDCRWGVPTRIIDPADDTIQYVYDYKGRLEKVIAPEELKKNRDYTVKYTYNLINHNLITTPEYDYTHVYKDMYDSLFVQKEVSLYDGRGRMMQKKHYAEVNGHDTWVVDGAEEWDAFGRVTTHEYPFIAQQVPYKYEAINHLQANEHFLYDILDRPLMQIHADGSDKQFIYHFKSDLDGILRFMTKTTDENGIVTSMLKSPQDWLIQQEAGDTSITFFEYSPIGELLYSTDADGYRTSYTYDMFGHMLSRTHPDAGQTTMTYDLAGNMISKKTANLALNNEEIQYIYKYSRLTGIRYPRHPENNVNYLYDAAGRISRRQDGVGTEEFIYDQLGNVAQSVRRIVIPTESKAYTFRNLFKYDSFGRMRYIVYPDGETVSYGYTTGGFLQNVAGRKGGQDNIYLWNRRYDEQGRKTYQLFGNNVGTSYKYDFNRQWLDSVHTEILSSDVLQELEYKYDYVGNINQITQSAPVLSSYNMGGVYVNDYVYDRQYRLRQSNESGCFPYTFHATYSPAGRMGEKSINTPVSSSLKFGYDKGYTTHQPRTAFDFAAMEDLNFFWDANGNLAQIMRCKQGGARLHEWDEENRLRLVLGDRYAGFYGYDGNGERVYKLTGISSLLQQNAGGTMAQVTFDDAVLYPNPYIVVTPKGYTKHYYAGTERLATVIGGGGFGDMTTPIESLTTDEYNDLVAPFWTHYSPFTEDPFYYDGALSNEVDVEDIDGKNDEELQYQCHSIGLDYVDAISLGDILLYAIEDYEQTIELETNIFYYHGDHLGSANWITNADGDAVQYIHYAPYGELIANQIPYGYDERYKFTGKERDEESGYDYFSARYLWYIIGHWLSVDPLADKYLWISPYAYAAWNPVKFIDPDGREKHNMMDPNTDDIGQCYLWEGAAQLPDPGDTDICFIAHGDQTSMYPHGSERPMSAEDFKAYILENSDAWKNTEDKSTLTIVLISCETAKGENPIAQQISKLLPDATIMAPTEEIRAFGQGEITSIGGSGKSGAQTMKELGDPKYAGQWRYYKAGELIGTSKNGYMYNIFKKPDVNENNGSL